MTLTTVPSMPQFGVKSLLSFTAVVATVLGLFVVPDDVAEVALLFLVVGSGIFAAAKVLNRWY